MTGQGAPGPPPLRSLGLVLHRDGRFLHEGAPIRNARLRAAFERGVRWLPREGKYVVTLGHFRGQLDVEEAGFFVRAVDLVHGTVALSDGSLPGGGFAHGTHAASLVLADLSVLESGAYDCVVSNACGPTPVMMSGVVQLSDPLTGAAGNDVVGRIWRALLVSGTMVGASWPLATAPASTRPAKVSEERIITIS